MSIRMAIVPSPASCSCSNLLPAVSARTGVAHVTCSRPAAFGQHGFSTRFSLSDGSLRNKIITRRPKSIQRHGVCVSAQKTDFLRVLGTVVRTGKDGLDAGTKFLPESVPRPVAQAVVGVLGVLVISYALRSLVSIASFILGIGGIAYVAYVYFNKDDDSGGDSKSSKSEQSLDTTLEEARRIMEKYR